MRLVLIVLGGLSVLSACSLLNTEPFSDTHYDSNGNLVLTDTDRNWAGFRETVDFRVASEVKGSRPPAGKQTWEEFWLSLIEAQQNGRENKQRYINYIEESRRLNGLPELTENT